MSSSIEVDQNNGGTPHAATLSHAANIAMQQDRPIMHDYYAPSTRREARLVKTQDKDTILYKNNEEYTSPLKKVFQIDGSETANGKDIICLSENSIYIVHSTILQKTA